MLPAADAADDDDADDARINALVEARVSQIINRRTIFQSVVSADASSTDGTDSIGMGMLGTGPAPEERRSLASRARAFELAKRRSLASNAPTKAPAPAPAPAPTPAPTPTPAHGRSAQWPQSAQSVQLLPLGPDNTSTDPASDPAAPDFTEVAAPCIAQNTAVHDRAATAAVVEGTAVPIDRAPGYTVLGPAAMAHSARSERRTDAALTLPATSRGSLPGIGGSGARGSPQLGPLPAIGASAPGRQGLRGGLPARGGDAGAGGGDRGGAKDIDSSGALPTAGKPKRRSSQSGSKSGSRSSGSSGGGSSRRASAAAAAAKRSGGSSTGSPGADRANPRPVPGGGAISKKMDAPDE